MVRGNRLSHALLLLGKEGTGGLPVALAFAQYLVCEKNAAARDTAPVPGLFGEPVAPAFAEDACGECAACKKASAFIHPDIHFSFPSIAKKPSSPAVSNDWMKEWREFISLHPYGSIFDWLQFINAENKQGNITAEECNEIMRKLSMKSYESRYKILIVWMPEYLGNNGNRLLKLIEEPPEDTLFLLVAENDNMILPTILSRTQLVGLPLLDTESIRTALTQRSAVPDEQARQLALLSEGNYREALNLLNHAGDDWQAYFRSWLNAIMKTGPIAQTRWVDEMSAQGREKQKQFLQYCIHLVEQAVRLQVMEGIGDSIAENEKDFAGRLNKLAGIGQQQAMIEEFNQAIGYIGRNANPKMLFHALTIKLYHIIANKSLILVN